MATFSKTQIDKLGERLRCGELINDDLQMLDGYRREFVQVYVTVLNKLQHANFDGEVSGRAAKTTESIIQKLQRHQTKSVRLSQVQDICGLRIVVETIPHQDLTVRRLIELFPGSTIDDRRVSPSYGYRAVHVIAPLLGLIAEIQVRTKYQHMWAQFCEQLADKLGVEVKYGGHPSAQNLLDTFSDAIRQFEEAEEPGTVGESPYSNPMVREEFMASFRRLMRFVVQGPHSSFTETDHVLPG
jgi:ppGpp synthetase/RelA/SpoT-type nucleotidyltranferase